MIKFYCPALLVVLCLANLRATAQHADTAKLAINDFNTPLHAMPPAYAVPYGVPTITSVKAVTDRVLLFLEAATPAQVVDKRTNAVINNYAQIDKNSVIKRGIFRLSSYEWGVTYAGMLLAYQNTGDERYKQYVASRLAFLSAIAPYFGKLNSADMTDPQMHQVLYPQALDDAGAVCSAMIKAQMLGININSRELIDRYINFILTKQYRLADGTLARKRPQNNTLWLDDMYMGIPAIANMGKLTGDTKYYDEAVKQVLQFSQRMFLPEKGLYRHGWVEGMEPHPAFHWGRANGWALMATVEVLDALPTNYPGREKVLALLKAHISALAALQSGNGFWHQLVDRNDTYPETSCTAIYTYCIAHAINMGWVDALAYGPVAVLGWNAVATKVNPAGEVEGTCVGTGMGFDAAFYSYRPVHKYAAHGYGSVLLAGAEITRLLKNYQPKIDDSAVQFNAK